jgi:membrane-associated phospholipid phosphatase
MENLNIRNYKIALAISFLIAVALFVLSYAIGHEKIFLLLNGDGGRIADYFFEYFTDAGDGLMWIPVLLITLYVLKRKDVWPLLISGFVASTIVTQIFKYLIVPDEPRPVKVIKDASLMHTVTGVELHSISSFPSGHTGTAFCFYILFCLLLPKNWWLVVGLVFASLVAYSRVYLAQHFPFDVAGGILVAVISMFISVKIQQWWWKRKKTF